MLINSNARSLLARDISDDFGAVSRLEVIAGPKGRRRWPAHVKARLVAGSFASDKPISEYARQYGLVPSQLFAWRRQARDGMLVLPADDDAGFATLLVETDGQPVSQSVGSNGTSGIISVELGDVTLRLPSDTPAIRIAEIVHALQGRS